MNNEFKNKKVLVMGLGLHGGGVAAARWLVKRGADVTVTDLRDRKALKSSLDKLKGLKIKYALGGHNAEDFKMADMAVQNPGVPYNSPYLKIAKKFGAEIVNEAALFFKYAKSKNIIGITGTKGKSTTSTLVHKILRAKWPKSLLAGNIRDTALLNIADRAEKNTPIVLELSSWQLEGLEKIRTSPRIAAITNIYQDHLNRYPSYQAYVAAKENI
ncbi:UDP-N-acetylmuramoyl-L-alanine--D-glutamate ligase, partial [Patescibacteria group bacterium]